MTARQKARWLRGARLVAALTLLGTNARGEEHGASENAVVRHDDHGFVLATPHDDFELRVFGIVQADARSYLRKADRTDYDRFLVRRARPYFEGHAGKGVDFRLMADLGSGTVDLLDAFVDVSLLGKALRFRAGKYKQPFSYEQFAMEDLTLAVFERSALDVLAPARNVGAMLHGSVGERRRFAYAVGLSNGLRDSDFEEKRNEKDFVGRFVVRPFVGGPAVGPWQVGISVAYGQERDAFDPNAFTSPMRVPYFHFTKDVEANGFRARFSPETAFFAGPFAAAAQAVVQRQAVVSTTIPGSATTVPIQAFYVMSSLVLTGERRSSYAQFIEPRRPVHLAHGWEGTGAFELLLRTSGLRVDTKAAARGGLVDRSEVSPSILEMTVGLNWYLTRWLWVMANAEHARFGTAVPLGTGSAGRLTHQESVGLRTTVMW